MKRDIPYYAQTAEFSCGPACLLMVMKGFDPWFDPSRTLEFELWRQCNMIGVRGADPYGLSVPLLETGYEVLLRTQRRRMAEPGLWRHRLRNHRFAAQDAELSLFGIGENRRRAQERGLNVEYGRPTVARIDRYGREGFVPVALVHMGVVHRFDIPHWVVVTGVDAGGVTFNDPYPPRGRKDLHVSRNDFQRMIDNIGRRIGLSPSVLFVRPTAPLPESL